MAKKRKTSPKININNDNVFDKNAEAGEFSKGKERAGPRGVTKSNADKVKVTSESQETFAANSKNITSEERSKIANQEFFSKHENANEKDTEYASQREETRAFRKHRHHEARSRVKESFIKKDVEFKDTEDFMKSATADSSKTDVTGNKKLERLQKKSEKAGKRTARARKKIPQQKEYKLVRHFDEKTGKVTYELQANKVPKKVKSQNPATAASRRAMMEAHGYVHQKISEKEKENSGVEGAHKTEEAGEYIIDYGKRFRRDKLIKQKNKVAKLEKKQFKAETNFRYQKYLEENPEVKKKAFQKRLQKQRIKREYAKALKKGADAKHAAGFAQKAANTTTTIARKIQEIIRTKSGVLITIGLFGLIFLMIATCVSSCGAMLGSGLSTTMAGSYQSVPAELDAADAAMTLREIELQNQIDNIETDYPDYDEYNYNLGEIGHNPFTLINYLSAVNVDFTASDVDSQIEDLFDEMYELTLTPREETRTRTVTNPDTGEEEEEEYTVTILDVELTVKSLEDVVSPKLTGDAADLYDTYNATKGALQQFYTPLDLDWYSLISSYYGYRKNPITGENQFHRGVDIAVPEGTDVYASQSGTVTTAEYDDSYGNYIVIQDADGYMTKYAHLESINVSAGQTVRHGQLIGKTGNTGASTGSHLHIECLYNGEYYNPLFYFENGNGSIYGDTTPGAYGDGDVAALFAEAEQYLGYPYVWGGSNPSTSFDCSGFVCYVLTHSGFYNMPRTTAQGIYNKCVRIDPSEAQAGDIIFFTGTYSSGNPVTHVGIYAGNGMMIHCGDPIKYASINTPYWQNHFYAFGRLPHD